MSNSDFIVLFNIFFDVFCCLICIVFLSSSLVKDFLDSMDKDGSGSVDTKELLEALDGCNFDESMIREFIAEHDQDHDGRLNLKELEDFLRGCGCIN